MKNILKCSEAEADVSSSLSRLPDEIILQILNKLMDLKTLCFCYLVSRRFSSIVLQVDAIAFAAPRINPHPGYDDNGGILWNVFCALINEPILLRLLTSKRDDELFPFISAISFLSKFRGVKSLCIELPSSREIGIDNRSLLKWKVKFGNRIESFYFLLPNSVSETEESHVNGNANEEEEEEEDMGFNNNFLEQNHKISVLCMKDAIAWHMMMLYFVKNLQKLEKISVTDSERRGRIFLSGEKLSQVKKFVHSASEDVIKHRESPVTLSNCYIPALNLPVSGYVMKGVYLLVREMKGVQGEYDGLMNSKDGLEGKEEAAYTEAVMEILEKHKGRMLRLM